MAAGEASLSPPRRVRPHPASLVRPGRVPEDRREACGERLRAEGDQIAVEVVALGHDDQGGDARACAAPDEAFGRPLAFGVVVAGDDEPG